MTSLQRQYECVVFGATGYTGKYAAEHITAHFPTDFAWAIAGRSEGKLRSLSEELRSINSDRDPPAIEVAELNLDDLVKLAKKTKVLISTVGPYNLYGTAAFEACAKTGTHYLDCTGEIPWVYDMVQKYHDLAKQTGAIMIPQNGVESAPPDLICWMLSSHVRKTLNARIAEAIVTVHELKGSPSGGTLATVLSLFDTYSLAQVSKTLRPWSLCAIGPPTSRNRRPGSEKLLGLRKDRNLGVLTDSISGATDLVIINRSRSLIENGSFYGSKFHPRAYMTAKSALGAFAWHVAVVVGTVAIVLSPVRWLIKKFVYQPGQGPSKEEAKKESCEWRAVGDVDVSGGSDPKRAYASIKWQGSLYAMTGTFLAEAALTIARDNTYAHQLGGGVLTPATLGEEYLRRLQMAGLQTEVKILP